MKNLIINTPMVRVVDSGQSYQMLITCKDGTVIEHEPFPKTLEGLVAAMSLSAEICAGKFYLSKVHSNIDESKLIASRKKV